LTSIAINRDSRMTRFLTHKTDVFRAEPVIIVDVGARWGFNSEWEAFGEHLRVVCFEADEEECRRLNTLAPSGVKYLPYALGRRAGKATFYETRVSASSGIYKTNMDYFSRLLNRDNGVVVIERSVDLVTLAQVLEELGVRSIDFIKLDVEGAEMDVLMGGEHYLKSGGLIGVLSEIRFQKEINGSPIFSELDQFLQMYGLRLYDLHFQHQSRHVLPYPGLADFRTPQGERFFAYSHHGQIMDGDALYFRDLLVPANQRHRATASIAQLLKAAAFFEIYCLSDCAAEIIQSHREKLAEAVDCDRLLDLLTPDVNGERLDYAGYLQRYFDPTGGVFAKFADSGERGAELELERIYSSRSWRITKPLRELGLLLRRMRG
jgi:FkbM family methyltransferase